MADAKEAAKRIRAVAQLGNLNSGDVEMAEMLTSAPDGISIEGPILTRDKDRIKCWKIAMQGFHGHEYIASLAFPPDFPRFSPRLVYRFRRGGGEDLVATIIRNARMMNGFTQRESESNLYSDLDDDVEVDVVSSDKEYYYAGLACADCVFDACRFSGHGTSASHAKRCCSRFARCFTRASDSLPV